MGSVCLSAGIAGVTLWNAQLLAQMMAEVASPQLVVDKSSGPMLRILFFAAVGCTAFSLLCALATWLGYERAVAIPCTSRDVFHEQCNAIVCVLVVHRCGCCAVVTVALLAAAAD